MVVSFPVDAWRAHALDTLACFLVSDGSAFEAAVVERERGAGGLVGALWGGGERTYLAWRVFSLANGDTLRTWRTQPFRMLAGGATWMPPPPVGGAGGGAGEAPTPAPAGERQLSPSELEQWSGCVAGLSLARGCVRSAMAWALDHAEAGPCVVSVAAAALRSPSASPLFRVAVLYALSDVLHNAHQPGATRAAAAYRPLLASALPDGLAALRDALGAEESRLAAQAARARVGAVLRCWQAWFVFPTDFLAGLQCTFAPPPQGALADDPVLRDALGAMSDDELRRRCRLWGVPAGGDRADAAARLLQHDVHTRLARGEQPPAQQQTALPQLGEVARNVEGDDRGGWVLS